MRRREVILGFTAAAAFNGGATAQQPRGLRRLGVLTTADDAQWLVELAAFRDEMKRLGWSEADC